MDKMKVNINMFSARLRALKTWFGAMASAETFSHQIQAVWWKGKHPSPIKLY